MKKNVLILLALILIFFSCKKDPNESTGRFKISYSVNVVNNSKGINIIYTDGFGIESKFVLDSTKNAWNLSYRCNVHHYFRLSTENKDTSDNYENTKIMIKAIVYNRYGATKEYSNDGSKFVNISGFTGNR